MRFLLDASAHRGLLVYLQDLGHDVRAVGVDYPRNLPDPEILAAAHLEQRVLITADSDFGELVYHRRGQHAGVIYLRLRDEALEVIQERVRHVLLTYTEPIRDFLVVSLRSVRVRGPNT